MKNKRLLIINILNVASIVIELIVGLIIGLLNKEESFIFNEICFLIAIFGIINFAFILIREASILSYDSKKFTTIMCVFHTFLAVLVYYIGFYFKQNNIPFKEHSIMLWIFISLAFILPSIIFPILNYFNGKNKKSDKPKFIVNK